MSGSGTDVAVDNDMVLKAVAYGLAEIFWPSGRRLGVLGAARYVVPPLLDRIGLVAGAQRARADFEALLAKCDELEPEPSEISLAAELEAAAQAIGLQLDGGESQLCAMVIERTIRRLETGDKRAIGALGSLRGQVDTLERLDGRVRCLEQVVQAAVLAEGQFQAIAVAVCAEPMVDKALTNCFACSSGTATIEGVCQGLESYISSLRAEAPNVLSRD